MRPSASLGLGVFWSILAIGCGDDSGSASAGSGGGGSNSGSSGSVSSAGTGGDAAGTGAGGPGGSGGDDGTGGGGGTGGSSDGLPTLAECPDPPASPEGANMAFRLGTGEVRCTRLEGSLSSANGTEGFSAGPTNESLDKAQVYVRGQPDIEVGTVHTGTRNPENFTVTDPPLTILFGGTYCPCAGTVTVVALENDGTSGTISGTIEGDINTTCATPPEPPEYTPVVARFEDVEFFVQE